MTKYVCIKIHIYLYEKNVFSIKKCPLCKLFGFSDFGLNSDIKPELPKLGKNSPLLALLGNKGALSASVS